MLLSRTVIEIHCEDTEPNNNFLEEMCHQTLRGKIDFRLDVFQALQLHILEFATRYDNQASKELLFTLGQRVRIKVKDGA